MGRRPHDPVRMFKIVVLQRYDDLNEEQTEYQILDRLSLQQLLGLDFEGKVPDQNAIRDFKERPGADGGRCSTASIAIYVAPLLQVTWFILEIEPENDFRNNIYDKELRSVISVTIPLNFTRPQTIMEFVSACERLYFVKHLT